MQKPLVIKNQISINAAIDRVWDVLTNPIHTPKYMFGCEAISKWKQGDPLTWEGVFDGKKVVAVKGEILRIEKPFLLEYSVFDPNSNYEDVPENYTSVIYKLSESEQGTSLTITQGDFASVVDGQKRYDDSMSAGGWSSILEQIRAVAEAPTS